MRWELITDKIPGIIPKYGVSPGWPWTIAHIITSYLILIFPWCILGITTSLRSACFPRSHSDIGNVMTQSRDWVETDASGPSTTLWKKNASAMRGWCESASSSFKSSIFLAHFRLNRAKAFQKYIWLKTMVEFRYNFALHMRFSFDLLHTRKTKGKERRRNFYHKDTFFRRF